MTANRGHHLGDDMQSISETHWHAQNVVPYLPFTLGNGDLLSGSQSSPTAGI